MGILFNIIKKNGNAFSNDIVNQNEYIFFIKVLLMGLVITTIFQFIMNFLFNSSYSFIEILKEKEILKNNIINTTMEVISNLIIIYLCWSLYGKIKHGINNFPNKIIDQSYYENNKESIRDLIIYSFVLNIFIFSLIYKINIFILIDNFIKPENFQNHIIFEAHQVLMKDNNLLHNEEITKPPLEENLILNNN